MKKIFTLILSAISLVGFAQSNVTFKVDMNQYGGSTDAGVFVNGNFTTNGAEWCGSCNPMTDANNDGIWEATIAITNTAIDFKFTVDGWNAQENFAGGEACTRTDGGFTNRHIASITADIVLDTVCFNSCTACLPLPPQDPTMGADAPMYPDTSVISLFSDVYTDVTVDTWRTVWSAADFSATSIDGDSMHLYNNLDFVGIETTGANTLDITGLDHINLDVWSPNATTFRVKLVNFGPGGNSEHEIAFENPALGEWVNYHIALDSFLNLNGRANISQLIFSAIPIGSARVYVDNIYFSKGEVPVAEPMTAAADPTDKEEDVISLFSNVYTDVAVTTWRTDWSAAGLEEIQIDGNDVKKYTNLDFVGIEATGENSIDASTMEHITFDAWTAEATTYRIKLVDFGSDNAFGGGDDTEFEIAFENPAQETWTNHKIALTDFTGLTATSNVSQLIFSAIPAGGTTFYIDNLYFSKAPTNSVSEAYFSSFNVYPNPANEKLTIAASTNGVNINTISLINIQGQTLNTQEVNSTIANSSMNVSNLASGVYFVKVSTVQGTHTERVIIK